MSGEPVVKYEALTSVSGVLTFVCPGCRYDHGITIGCKNSSGGQWSWNGDLVRPTVKPSINGRVGPWPEGSKKAGQTDVCHCWVRNGQIEFCGDSTHELKGQTVPLRPFS